MHAAHLLLSGNPEKIFASTPLNFATPFGGGEGPTAAPDPPDPPDGETEDAAEITCWRGETAGGAEVGRWAPKTPAAPEWGLSRSSSALSTLVTSLREVQSTRIGHQTFHNYDCTFVHYVCA